MKLETATIIGAVSALFIAAVLYLLFVPKKKGGHANRYAQGAHNFFNFKYLLIEVIAKYLYIYATFYYFTKGFFMMFVDYGYEHYDVWEGIKVMLLGPIQVRVGYELIMMYILKVKKLISIEAKLTESKEASPFDLTKEAILPARVVPVGYAPYGYPAGYGAPGYGAPGYGAPPVPPTGYAPAAPGYNAPVAPAGYAPAAPVAAPAPAAAPAAPAIIGYDVNTGAPIYDNN